MRERKVRVRRDGEKAVGPSAVGMDGSAAISSPQLPLVRCTYSYSYSDTDHN